MKKIYFIYMPSPLLGRYVYPGKNGGAFSFTREDKYIATVQKAIQTRNINWSIERDDTESDIQKLIKKDAQLLICVPGLRFMFYRKGFDKKRIIYLTTMQYWNMDIKPVIDKIKALDDEEQS